MRLVGGQDRDSSSDARRRFLAGRVDECARRTKVRSRSAQGSWQQRPGVAEATARVALEQAGRVERDEIEARTSLIRQEAHRTSSEVRLIDAEARQREADAEYAEAKTTALDFAVFRQAVYFVFGIAIAVIVAVRLLTDPAVIDAAAGGTLTAAFLAWIGRR
jgi:hypothetical protein